MMVAFFLLILRASEGGRAGIQRVIGKIGATLKDIISLAVE